MLVVDFTRNPLYQPEPPIGWGWSLTAGLIHALFVVYKLTMLPDAGRWLIGLLLGVDLFFVGVAWVLWSFPVRKIPVGQVSPAFAPLNIDSTDSPMAQVVIKSQALRKLDPLNFEKGH